MRKIKYTALMEIPQCPACGERMELRPLTRQTPEQQYCGTWYDCISPGCCGTILLPSVEIAEEHKKAGNPIFHPNLV